MIFLDYNRFLCGTGDCPLYRKEIIKGGIIQNFSIRTEMYVGCCALSATVRHSCG